MVTPMKGARRAWRWLWTVNPWLIDGPLALAFTVSALVESGDRPGFAPLTTLTTVPLAARRVAPIPAVLVMFTSLVVIGPHATLSAFFALLIATYSVGAHSSHRLLGLAVTIALVAGIVAIYGGGSLPPVPSWLLPPILLLPLWLAGNSIRTKQQRADALHDHALQLEHERDAAERAAAAAERSRIARELHDVISHSVGVMMVQAGAARQVLRHDPEAAARSLESVEGAGREAVDELRRLLGLLGDEQNAPLAPQPGLSSLAGLVERVRSAGLPVELQVEGDARSLPAGLDLAAYRIVQEALTNALRYASGAPTRVLLHYYERDLKLEILNEGDEAASTSELPGRGLIGMRERVALYGGEIEAGRRPGGGYAIRARIPLEPA
jgi:signal transduction histidine kinase